MGWDWGGAGSGAASGAAAGTSIMPGWGTAIGGVAGGLMGGLKGGSKKDPMKEANKYYSQIPDTMKGYYNPYINAGKRSIHPYQNMMQTLMQNPDEFINKMGAGYTKSPGYDWNLKQGQSAITNASAAGGMAGSPQHEQQAAEMATGMASKDYQSYMDRIMQGLGIGTQGMGNIFNTGASMSSDLATSLANALMTQGNMAYEGAMGGNKTKGAQAGGMMSGMGDIASNWKNFNSTGSGQPSVAHPGMR